MSHLVSIIVPVYKVEKYLEQCVNSITSQTYQDIEVILVDDGSPDRSGEIADELASKDDRIIVIHQPNSGQSCARSTGLSRASGLSVLFMDSDDFWRDNECLERLVHEMSKTPDCDFIGFNCTYYYEGEETYTEWPAYSEEAVNETDKKELIIKLVKTGMFPMSACLKIINRDFLVKNNIDFIPGIYAEDIPWFLDMLRKTKKCRLINDYIYAYRQTHAESITHTYSPKKTNDLLNILKSEVAILKQSDESQQLKDALLSFLAYEWCILVGGLNKIRDKKIQDEKRRELKEYKWLLHYTANPKVKKVALLYRFVGFHLTERALRYYLKNRKNA